MRRQIFAECIRNRYFLERDLLIWNRHVILREANIDYFLAGSAVKAVKLIAAEGTGDLSCAVRTEVEEDNGIAILDRSCGNSIF